MRNRKIIFLSLVLVAVITTAVSLTAEPNPAVMESQKKESTNDQLPVADYKISALTKVNGEPNRGRRHIREEKDAIEITEAESRIERLPAIPWAESEAVVIGSLVDAHAYLTPDNRQVFTQYTVVVEEVLKNQGSLDDVAGAVLKVQREGGRVRFPSGRIQTYRLSGQGVPRVGRRHLIFVKDYDQVSAFLMLTAFELHNDRVSPIDGVEAQARYKNLSEAEFMKLVRGLITSSR